MSEYLFVFGYESPHDRRTNLDQGTDFESSNAIWVTAQSKQEALEIGQKYAEKWVADLFVAQGVTDFEGWRKSGFAHWIEDKSNVVFPTAALTELKRIAERDLKSSGS